MQRIDEAPAMVIGLVFLTGLAAAFFWGFNLQARAVLEKWAHENGFRIQNKQRRIFFIGPFSWWTTRRGQAVYRFLVSDESGHQRWGWARCGSYIGGVAFSNHIDIRWDEESDRS